MFIFHLFTIFPGRIISEGILLHVSFSFWFEDVLQKARKLFSMNKNNGEENGELFKKSFTASSFRSQMSNVMKASVLS